MNEQAGYLNEPDLIEEIINQSLEYVELGDKSNVGTTILATFKVMLKRGLLSDLGVEQVRKSLEHYSQRQ